MEAYSWFHRYNHQFEESTVQGGSGNTPSPSYDGDDGSPRGGDHEH